MVSAAEKARQLFFKKVDNCYWNPNLEIIELSNGDRTVIAKDSIKQGSVLVVLNKDSAFSNEKARQLSKYPLDGLDESLIIPAYLYQFYTKQVDNVPVGYDHYFNALPTYEWYAENHLLLKTYLNNQDADFKALGSSLFLINRFITLIEWAETYATPEQPVNREQAIRAAIACATRAWSSIGLVPWIDFFNHSYNGSLLSNGGTSIEATHFYEKGEQVNTSYGPKDSLQLLSIYGFVADEKTLTIYRPNISPLAPAIDAEIKKYQAFAEEYPFLLDAELNNFNSFIAHFRLSALKKHDLFFINDLEQEYKRIINVENEYQAIKLAMYCIDKTENHLKQIVEQVTGVLLEIPQEFKDDFNSKFEIINKIRTRFIEYWNSLILD